MENIGKKWRDKKGDVVVNMPVPAAFICEEYPGSYQIKLVEVEHMTRPSGEDERVAGTGLTIVIEGGKIEISNSSILEHLMACSAYQSGTVRIDPEDPTGFWESVGAVKPVMKKVVEYPELVRNPTFGSLPKDLKKMEQPEETPEPMVLGKG